MREGGVVIRLACILVAPLLVAAGITVKLRTLNAPSLREYEL